MTKLTEYRKLLSLQQESEALKNLIKESEEYVNYEMNIKALQADQNDMLSDVVDYTEAIGDLEQEIIEEAKEKKIYSTDDFSIKFKEHKKVNPLALKHVLDDEDAFMTLIDVKQKVLKDFAKDNEAVKKALYSCIEVVKREPVGIILKD